MTRREQAEGALRRVETLIATLEGLAETRGRDIARELLEAVLDLHGVALARMSAIVAASEDGERLLQSMAADDQVAAVLLLHGLHPQMAEARVRNAVGRLQPLLQSRGADLRLVEVSDGVARLRLRIPGASREDAALLRHEVEAAIVEAAPDLDEIAIFNEVANEPAVAAA